MRAQALLLVLVPLLAGCASAPKLPGGADPTPTPFVCPDTMECAPKPTPFECPADMVCTPRPPTPSPTPSPLQGCAQETSYEGWEDGLAGWTVEGSGASLTKEGHRGCGLLLDPACCVSGAVNQDVSIPLEGVRTFSFLFRENALSGDTDAAFRVRLDTGQTLHYQVTEGVSPNNGVSVVSSYGEAERSFGSWSKAGAWYKAALVLDGPGARFRGELWTVEGAPLATSAWHPLPPGAGAVTQLRFEAVAWTNKTVKVQVDSLDLS